jgi:HEAT repeat protein
VAAVRYSNKRIAPKKRRFLSTGILLLACLGCGGEEPPEKTPAVDSREVTVSVPASAPVEPESDIELDRAIRGLQSVIDRGQWDEKAEKIRQVAQFGPSAHAAIPLLDDLIASDRDEHWLVRSEVICALAAIGPGALTKAAAGLEDRDRRVRRTTAYALGKVDHKSDELLAVFRDALRNSDWEVRAEAVRSLASHGADATAEIREALKDADPRVRTAAAWSLRQLGPQAKPAIPDLQAALHDENWLVRSAAVYALGQMGEEAAAEISAMTKDENWGVRSAAYQALEELGR